MKIYFDFSNLETSENEKTSTATFGGSFLINGKSYLASGTDRDGGLIDCIIDAVEDQLGRALDDKEVDELLDSPLGNYYGVGEVDFSFGPEFKPDGKKWFVVPVEISISGELRVRASSASNALEIAKKQYFESGGKLRNGSREIQWMDDLIAEVD